VAFLYSNFYCTAAPTTTDRPSEPSR